MDDKFEKKRKNFPEDIPKDMLEYTFCGAYRDVDFSGYKSPIQVFEKDLGVKITQEIERTVFRKMMMLGVSIDKDALMRALEYDRNQYAEGYYHGYRAGVEAAQPKWISVEERPPELPCICYDGKNPPHEVKKLHTLSSLKWTRYFSYDPFEYLDMMQQACDSDDTIDIGSMTHILFWMPMPDEPKHDGHDGGGK